MAGGTYLARLEASGMPGRADQFQDTATKTLYGLVAARLTMRRIRGRDDHQDGGRGAPQPPHFLHLWRIYRQKSANGSFLDGLFALPSIQRLVGLMDETGKSAQQGSGMALPPN